MNHPSITERVFRKTGRPNIRYEVSDARVFDRLFVSSGCLLVAYRRPTYSPNQLHTTIHELPLRDRVILENGILRHNEQTGPAEYFYKAYLNFYRKLYEEVAP